MTMDLDAGAPALFRAVDLQPDGPAVLGRPIRASGRGVYVVELPAALPAPPLDIARIGKWIEGLPELRLDGARPTAKALAARLTSFWLPSRRVLFLGAAETSVAGRLTALERHVLGERRPHASSQWLKTLRPEGLRVWWAHTTATEEYLDALFGAFSATVPASEAAALPDPSVVLPWANLRAGGTAKPHRITGAVPPAERERPVPPERVVDVPPGDADGARVERRGTGTVRRPAPDGRQPRATRTTTPRSPTSGRRAPDPVLLSAEGLATLEAEHGSLLARRPEIVARIRTAKELGDLKENSDYTSAREEQSFLEGRIQAVEAQLRAAVVVAERAGGDRVVVGSSVNVEIDGQERRFTIVGTAEARPASGRISDGSPVGRALLGRTVGEEAVATTPGGSVSVKVLSIE